MGEIQFDTIRIKKSVCGFHFVAKQYQKKVPKLFLGGEVLLPIVTLDIDINFTF